MDVSTPSLRPEPKKIDRTLILVTGVSGEGKSFLSTQLINDKINYLSMDKVVTIDTNIETIETFKRTLVKPSHQVNQINTHINKKCSKEFINMVFEKYVDKFEKKTILLDGHIFTLNNINTELIKKCKKTSTRLWVIKKEKF